MDEMRMKQRQEPEVFYYDYATPLGMLRIDREIKCICNTYTTEMRWKGYKKNGPGMVPDARKPVPVRESGDVGRVDFF